MVRRIMAGVAAVGAGFVLMLASGGAASAQTITAQMCVDNGGAVVDDGYGLVCHGGSWHGWRVSG